MECSKSWVADKRIPVIQTFKTIRCRNAMQTRCPVDAMTTCYSRRSYMIVIQKEEKTLGNSGWTQPIKTEHPCRRRVFMTCVKAPIFLYELSTL